MHRETGRGDPNRDTLDTYLDELADHHAAVGATPQGRVSARLTVTAADPNAAVTIALEADQAAALAADLGGYVTALTIADATTPDGEATWIRTPLLGFTDIGKLLGVSRQRAAQLASEHPLFPPAVAHTASGSLFEEAGIRAFQDSWKRKVGRPSGQPLRA
jgi:hypothetical protein